MGMKKVMKKTGKIVSSPVRVPIKKIKKHHDAKKEHPEDDIPEEVVDTNEYVEDNIPKETVDTNESSVVPGFVFSGSYSFDENGNLAENNSSTTTVPENNVPNTVINEIIMNNEAIKELVPNISAENISLFNGMLLLTIPRSENSSESFRIDLIDGKVWIQAPLSVPYIDSRTKIAYKFASVDVTSDIGREILKNENYIIEMMSIDTPNTILRETQDAA